MKGWMILILVVALLLISCKSEVKKYDLKIYDLICYEEILSVANMTLDGRNYSLYGCAIPHGEGGFLVNTTNFNYTELKTMLILKRGNDK